jgi:Flp pilus assembly protein TadD
MYSEEAMKSGKEPSGAHGGWLSVIVDTIVLLGYFASLSLLIVGWGSDFQQRGILVHLVMNALLLLVGVRVLREREVRRRVCAIDFLVILFVLTVGFNVVVAEVKHAALMRLPLYVDYAIAYWIGSVVFSRRAGAFYALLVGFSVMMWVAFVTSPRPGGAFPSALHLLGIAGGFSAVGFLFAVRGRPSVEWSRLATAVFLAGIIGIGVVNYVTTSGDGRGAGLQQARAYYCGALAAGRMVNASPILGYGIGNFELVGRRFSPVLPSDGVHLRNSHLLDLVELGAVGLMVKWLVLISLLVWAYRRRVPWQMWENAVYSRLSLSLICVMLIDGFWFPALAEGSGALLFWGIAGLLVGKCLDAGQRMSPEHADASYTFRRESTAAPGGASDEEKGEVTVQHGETFTFGARQRFGRRAGGRLSTVRMWVNICLLVGAVTVLTMVEVLPAAANRLAQRRQGEALWSKQYGKRLAWASYLMPYDPSYQMKRALHYRALMEQEGQAAIYMPLIAHAYERAVELDPYEEEAAVQLARFYLVTGDYLSMINTLESSLAYLPMSPVLYAWMAKACIKAGHYEKALEALEQLSLLVPANAAVHATMEALYERLGEYREALSQAYYVLQKNPSSVEMWDKIRYLKLRVTH